MRFTPPPQRVHGPYSPGVSPSNLDASRRSALETVAAVEQRNTRITGSVVVTGTGEASTTITFPAAFVEKPVVMFSYERTYAPEEAVSPTFSGVITAFTTDTDANGDPVRYRAATITLVIGGDEGQQGLLVWTADGRVVLDSGF